MSPKQKIDENQTKQPISAWSKRLRKSSGVPQQTKMI